MFLPLDADDLAHITFRVAPWWETAAAVHAIARVPAMHREWATTARRTLKSDPHWSIHWPVLTTFIQTEKGGRGFIMASLTPPPMADATFEESRRQVLAQSEEELTAYLPDFQTMTTDPARKSILDEFELNPHAVMERVCEAMTWVWRLTVEPHWARIRALAIEDISFRLSLLSQGGLDKVLSTLHPRIVRQAGGLELLGKMNITADEDAPPGLVLVPSVFAWPGTALLLGGNATATISYVPRGVGSLWEEVGERSATSPLARLIGATRAAILQRLDLPMTTTYVAELLVISPATASEHLKVLAAAGLLTATRRGREVFYSQTELAESLLSES